MGDLQGARDLLEQTLAARRRVLGDDHPHTLVSMSHLAETRRNQGDLQAACGLHEETLAARRRVLGDDHPKTLWSMYNLAETLGSSATYRALTCCTSRPWPPASGYSAKTTQTPSPR
jgi:hypothetical protein